MRLIENDVRHDRIGQEPSVEWQPIQKSLGRFPGKVLVIIDACFAGSIMRSAEDHDSSLCNLVGIQRGSHLSDGSIIPQDVELWLATSFHDQTPLKEPTFTQAIIRTLEKRLMHVGTSITVSRAHKAMVELGSGNNLQRQPIYHPLENKYQKSIEFHHFHTPKSIVVQQSPSAVMDLRLQLDTLDEDTMPMLVEWLTAHPSNVISKECQTFETCIRAAHQYVLRSAQEPVPKKTLTPFQQLSDSFKQRTFDTYRAPTQSAIAFLRVYSYRTNAIRSSAQTAQKARIASQELEAACTRFKVQMQQNILLGSDTSKEDAVIGMMNDPDTRHMGLLQFLRMRLLSLRNNEQPAQSLNPPSSLGAVAARSDGPLTFLANGVHAVEYKTYPKDINKQLQAIHENRIDCLAKVLKEASAERDMTSSTKFLTLNCVGYFSEPSRYRFGLKFELPARHENSPEPITLWSALKSGKMYRLPLQQRLGLAKQISKALLNWHMAGWHHQEISSRNIHFFSTPESPEPDFTAPYLCGFDFSRESGKISTIREPKDMEFSVYRHPERQFDTTSAHRLRHDIYSLGVVLLDLGLWDDPEESWKSTMDNKPQNHDQARAVYNRLRTFTNRLNFYVGSCYAEAVRNCLDDRCFNTGSDRETTESFIDEVLNKLHDGAAL